jgi:hypothetical protein
MSPLQLYRGSLVMKSSEQSLTSDDRTNSMKTPIFQSTSDTKEQEIWKTIKDYPNYEVSSFGKIRNLRTGRLLSTTKLNRDGYNTVGLYKNKGKQFRKCVSIHLFVAKAFLKKVRGKDFVNHIDKNKTNNHMDNLRYVTHQEANMGNRISSRNTSGFKGVSLNKERNQWQAYLSINYKQLSLGYYDSKDAAIAARKEAEIKYFGDYR